MNRTGGLRCWGANYVGQCGRPPGQVGYSPPPTDLPSLTGVAQVVAGAEHTCVLLSTSGVRCWGNNQYGQIGRPSSTADIFTPPTTDLLTGVSLIVAGAFHTCALMTATGGFRCWGRNNMGQLGFPSGDFYGVPTTDTTINLGSAMYLTAGAYHTCALVRTSDGTSGMRCWGRGGEGQLGNRLFSNLNTVPTTSIQPSFVCPGGCQHGTCIAPGVCQCADRYSGFSCSNVLCSPPCSRQGRCAGPNTCQCNSGWTGALCDVPTCNAVNNCNGHGRCTWLNPCTCDSGWTGNDCSQKVCTSISIWFCL
jgi:hypothetical protein